MLLGIGGDRDFNIWITLLDASDQIGGRSVAFGVRRISRAEPAGGVAAQRHDMADANLVISRHHLIDIAAWRVNAGEMRRRREAGFGEDAGNGRVGAFPGRTAGAIGHRNEIGGKWREAADGLPETALHLFGFGRKKFKRDRGRQRAAAIRRGGRKLGHGTTNSTLKLYIGDACATPGSGELKIGQCTLVLIAHRTWEIAHLPAKIRRNSGMTYNKWAKLMAPKPSVSPKIPWHGEI